MKKGNLLVGIILILSLTMATGCKDSSQKESSDVPVRTSFAHGNPTGVWLMLATGVAESLGRNYPGSTMEVSPGNNYSNLFRMEEYKTEFGLTHTTIAYEGIMGNESFEKPLQNVGGIAVFYPSMSQFLVKEKFGITTFDEFISQKIPLKLSIGRDNMNAQIALSRLLSEYDLTFEDLEEWGCKLYTKNHKDCIEMVSDDVLDAVWTVAGAPTPALMQIATNTEMVLLDLSEDIINTMHNKYGYNPHTLAGGSYNFADNNVHSFSTFTMMAASLQTPEETAYKVTRSICENVEYISLIHSALANLTIDSLLEGMPIPLHPGAEKYYREIGFID